MKKLLALVWPALVFLLLFLLWAATTARAEEYKVSGRLSPSDYLMGTNGEPRDPVFDKFRTIDLGANLGVGSDCGRIDVKSTLRASLQNLLDAKYFGDMGRDILAASPMLATCYFSPTWCAILKHGQINANLLSKMRLDQCSIIDKYVDSRTEDYYQERQACVRRSIESNGGNMEQAMESCRGSSIYQADLANWAGEKFGKRASTNKLIDSSAKWAGFDNLESKDSVDLVKSMVGDTVLARGSLSVDFGPRSTPLTPRTYLLSIEKLTYEKLCEKLVAKAVESPEKPLEQIATPEALKELSPNAGVLLVDRQTIRSLVYMSPRQREMACRKVAGAVAMTIFSTDLNRSLDLMTTMAQNPNLPPQRKAEIEQKRRALKEQVELTVELNRQKAEPLNAILSQVNEEGKRLQSESVGSALSLDEAGQSNHRSQLNFMDCADGVMCAKGGR